MTASTRARSPRAAPRQRSHAMSPSVPVVLAMALASAGTAAGQCRQQWLPTPSGLDGAAAAAFAWDPDGPGPSPELLLLGGSFSVAGGVPAYGLAAWDGSH